MALKFPELLGNPLMTDLVLSCRDRASFCSSIWSSWAMAPSDLHLVAEVSNSLNPGLFSWPNNIPEWGGRSPRWDDLVPISPTGKHCQDSALHYWTYSGIKPGGWRTCRKLPLILFMALLVNFFSPGCADRGEYQSCHCRQRPDLYWVLCS